MKSVTDKFKQKFSTREWANHNYSPAYLRIIAFVSFALSIFLIYTVTESDKAFPIYNELIFDEGHISKLEKDKYGIDFFLSKSGHKYRYYSKARAMGAVWRELKTGDVAKVGRSPNDAESYTVYDLSIDGQTVRSYDEIREAYQADNELVNWMSPAFFLIGCFLLLMAHLTEKYREQAEIDRQRREAGFGP